MKSTYISLCMSLPCDTRHMTFTPYRLGTALVSFILYNIIVNKLTLNWEEALIYQLWPAPSPSLLELLLQPSLSFVLVSPILCSQ